MLQRVVRTLEASPRISGIQVSIDAPELLQGFSGLSGAISRGALQVLPSADSPSRSVLAALDSLGDYPVLITTADHALLDGPMLEEFLAGAEGSGADLAVGLVPRSILEKRFPGARRTYLPFKGESFSGANLFAFLTPEARRVAEFWQQAESHRKRPWRLVSVFGPISLLLFALRRLDLASALGRASRVIGARVAAVEMSRAEAALDVDRMSDLELVREWVASRQRA